MIAFSNILKLDLCQNHLGIDTFEIFAIQFNTNNSSMICYHKDILGKGTSSLSKT